MLIGITNTSSKEVINAVLSWMATTQSNDAKLHLDTLKKVRTDAGSGFTSKEFQDMCNLRGIRFSFAAPRHQETNGLAERSWRSIRDLAFAMMNHALVGDELSALGPCATLGLGSLISICEGEGP